MLVFLVREQDVRMIRSFKHKGLKNLFLENQTRGLSREHVSRIRNRLAVINAAEKTKILVYQVIGFMR